jgi:xylulokinase
VSATDRPLLLGVDVGSSRIKALLLDGDGTTVAVSRVPTPFVDGDGSEMTVPALAGALRQLLDDLGDRRSRVAAVGITGVAESGAPLDAAGSPLAPIIAWHDRRGEDVADRLTEDLGPGLHEMIGQRLRSVSTVAKLGWLVQNGMSGVTRWLGVPELFLHSLTGAEATEHSLAARTGCRDIGRGVWMNDVAKAAGFAVDVFPEVAAAGDVMGRVTTEAARSLGLPAGIPVTVAGHDHLAGMVGSGARPDDLANSVGTAETVVGRSPDLPDVAAAIERGLAVTVFPGGGEWAVLASAARSGIALEDGAARLGLPLAELDALADGTHLLDAPGLSESLERREPPVLPHGDPGAVWHTLLHHLAARTARAAVQVVSLLGPRRRLVVFGGGAASTVWLSAKAELAPLPVWRSTPDAAARGAAVFAGVAAGWWPSPAAAPPPPLQPIDP